jgi:hypothetical protein
MKQIHNYYVLFNITLFYTFLHFKRRFSTSLINTCFWDSIIRYFTLFVKIVKSIVRSFTLR